MEEKDCANCKWVGYCGGEFEYICDLKRMIVKEYADHLGMNILNNWFINPKLCEFYIKSEKSEEEIRRTGLGRVRRSSE